jgi:hypothetical protein
VKLSWQPRSSASLKSDQFIDSLILQKGQDDVVLIPDLLYDKPSFRPDSAVVHRS